MTGLPTVFPFPSPLRLSPRWLSSSSWCKTGPHGPPPNARRPRRLPGLGVALVLAAALAAAAATAATTDDRAAAGRPPATQETPPPDYSAYLQSYHVPFANTRPVDFDHLQSLSVRASLNGGPPLRFQVDTGSTGVVVGAADVPNIDPDAPPGSITYSSSGVELVGVWTQVTITFPDSKNDRGDVATAVVPVLAVSERKVHPGAVNANVAKPSKNPKAFMFGVGTGRGADAHQERNPWVNLKEMRAGTMRRGYTITRDGFTLGLAAETVGRGYLFEKLTEHAGSRPATGPADGPAALPTTRPAPKDWDGSRGWVTVAGRERAASSMLLDTGLTNMMIAGPDAAATVDVEAGTEVIVNLLGGRLQYGFKVGDTTNPATPRKVTWVKRPGKPLVNTGLRALALYDYLYDADGGYLGLRERK